MSLPPSSTHDSREVAADWLGRHGDVLFRFAVARVGDETTAEDLVQETLLAAISSSDAFRGESAERTWLIGILRHKVLDHFRKLARERQLRDDSIAAAKANGENADKDFDDRGRWRASPHEWGSPERSLEESEFWQVFDECVGALPEKLKTPFALRELDGLDSEALANVLKVTKNNLWVMLSRARQQLRRCLERRWFQAAGRHPGGL